MDTIEAKKNLKIEEENRARLINYNHFNSRFAFKQSCEAELREVNKRIQTIKSNLERHKRVLQEL